MKLFSGIEQIKGMSPDKRQSFERFFSVQINGRLLPLFIDLSLVLTLLGTILYIAMLAQSVGGFEYVPGLSYGYFILLTALLIANRFSGLRRKAPLALYLLFFYMALFTYGSFINTGGETVTIFGLILFLSSVGFVSVSLVHTGIILGLNLAVLYFSSQKVAVDDPMHNVFLSIVGNWFFLMSHAIAILSALFSRWMFKHMFALQFMLNDRNALLTETFQTLKSTESHLITQQKHKALNHMAAGLLHEIMNPVNCSMQAIKYAKTLTDESHVTEVLDDAVSNQNRIVNIIEDLKTFAAEEPEQQLETVPLMPLLEHAIKFCQGDLKGVDINLAKVDKIELNCFPSALTQVLVNILTNAGTALKKLPESLTKTIEISATQAENHINLVILDNGYGIQEEEMKRLSEPFYTTSDQSGNLGLGLGICQTIMRHHHGQLLIESDYGKWTRVTLSLPS